MAAIKTLKTRAEAAERDLDKILGECITEAQSAKDRPDGRLEPPWEVVARLKRDARVLRRLEERAKHDAELALLIAEARQEEA